MGDRGEHDLGGLFGRQFTLKLLGGGDVVEEEDYSVVVTADEDGLDPSVEVLDLS